MIALSPANHNDYLRTGSNQLWKLQTQKSGRFSGKKPNKQKRQRVTEFGHPQPDVHGPSSCLPSRLVVNKQLSGRKYIVVNEGSLLAHSACSHYRGVLICADAPHFNAQPIISIRMMKTPSPLQRSPKIQASSPPPCFLCVQFLALAVALRSPAVHVVIRRGRTHEHPAWPCCRMGLPDGRNLDVEQVVGSRC